MVCPADECVAGRKQRKNRPKKSGEVFVCVDGGDEGGGGGGVGGGGQITLRV